METFLSSYLWCDNYVVQDDNFGPAYHISCSFLTDYYDYGVALEKLNLNMSSNSPSNNFAPDYPLAALIIPPKGLKKLTENLYEVERIAATLFVDKIELFALDRIFKKFTVKQKELFDRYFYYIFKNNLGNRQRVFICRTILVSKDEYLASEGVQELYSDHLMGDSDLSLLEALGDLLPDYFWLTEISVPELFWVNKAKIGEIITDIEELQDNRKEKDPIFTREENVASRKDNREPVSENYPTENLDGKTTPKQETAAPSLENIGLRLIRLPYLVSLFPKGDDTYYPSYLSNQAEPHQPILKKEEGIIRQYKKGK